MQLSDVGAVSGGAAEGELIMARVARHALHGAHELVAPLVESSWGGPKDSPTIPPGYAKPVI